MIEKLFCTIIALILSIALTGCGSVDTSEKNVTELELDISGLTDMEQGLDDFVNASFARECAGGDPISYETRLISAFQKRNGSITAAAVVYVTDTDIPVSCYLFTLLPEIGKADTDPLFPYRVSSMTLSPAVNSDDDLPTLIGNYQGFSDHHTVEFLIDGNLMAFQVYDREIITLLSQAAENQEMTFAVKIDKTTENRTITSLIYR